MLGEIPYMIVWGFFSAMGWMTASYTVEKYIPEKPKPETQICTEWREEILPNGTSSRTRTCEKTSP
jgi:hypothetical protein